MVCTFDIVPSPGALSRTILLGQASSRAVLRSGPPKAPITGIASPWATTQVRPSSYRTRHRCSSRCAHYTSPASRSPPLESPISGSSQSGSHACQDYHIMEFPYRFYLIVAKASKNQSRYNRDARDTVHNRPCRLISHTQVKQ